MRRDTAQRTDPSEGVRQQFGWSPFVALRIVSGVPCFERDANLPTDGGRLVGYARRHS